MVTVNLQFNKKMQPGNSCPACHDEEAVLPAITHMLIDEKLVPAGKYLVGVKCHKKQWVLYYGKPGKDYDKGG